jgi:hypothetical protein
MRYKGEYMHKYLVPPINIKGKFRVTDELNGIIRSDVEYKVTGVRSIKDIIADGIDVKQLVYLNQGLTEDEYKQDLEDDVPIVTLQSPSNDIYNIPASKIISIPDYTGVKYTERTIAINLGQLPDKLDLDFIIPDINDLIKSRIGVEPKTKVFKTSQPIIYTHTEYETNEAIRKAVITNNESCFSKLQKLNTAFDIHKKRTKLLLKRLNELEKKCGDNNGN